MTKPEEKNTPKDAEKKTKSISKVTHLYLHDKYLPSINNLSKYTSLTVLYLHNNEIDKIQNLQYLRNLISLYLQKNEIKKIENLDNLTKLKRLYIGHNRIRVVENLENLESLEELHIEKQMLDSSDALCFDPRTILYLARSLQVLNVSHNNLTTIDNLAPLKYIKIINVAHNKIKCMKNITDAVQNWYYLEEAKFTGNPISKEHRYKESVIGNTTQLRLLDDKQINDTTRCFIKRFEQEKVNFEQKSAFKLPQEVTDVTKNYPVSIQKAVSSLILKSSKSIDDNKILSTNMSLSEAYIPWKCLPSSFTSAKNKVPPSLRKHKRRNKPKPSLVSNFSSFL